MRLFKIIGMPILLSIVLVGVLISFTNIGGEYGVNYDNTSLENIVNSSQEFKTVSEDFKESDDNRFSSVTNDIEGSLLNQALKSLDTVKKSIGSFGKIISNTVGMTGIGNDRFSSFLIGSLVSLILIAITIGIFTTALFRVRL